MLLLVAAFVALLTGYCLLALVRKTYQGIVKKKDFQSLYITGFVAGVCGSLSFIVLLVYGVTKGHIDFLFFIFFFPSSIFLFTLTIFSLFWLPINIVLFFLPHGHLVHKYLLTQSVMSVLCFVLASSVSANFCGEQLATIKVLNPDTHSQDIYKIYDKAKAKKWMLTLAAISKRTNTPEKILSDIVLNPIGSMFNNHEGEFFNFYKLSGNIFYFIASNSSTPPETLDYLSRLEGSFLTNLIQRHQGTSLHTASKRKRFSSIIRTIVAENKNTKINTLRRLTTPPERDGKTTCKRIYRHLLENYNTPSDLLIKISKDCHAELSIANKIMSHQNTPKEVIVYYSHLKNKHIRNEALKRLSEQGNASPSE